MIGNGAGFRLAVADLFVGCFQVFRLCLLLLAFGDPAAGIAGALYRRGCSSRQSLGSGKTIAGSFGACFANFVALVSYEIYQCPDRCPVRSGLAEKCAFAALVGATAERIHLGVDDNFSLPILSGFALSAAHLQWGWFAPGCELNS